MDLTNSKVGIYMRLSRDDGAGESVSIENQRDILYAFVGERGGRVADEYADDGWSGTDFERPQVKRLLADAQSGRIDTIVVKDLSRFGRNYIRVGQYIDYIFPAYGIRFIAIGDGVDTADAGSAAMDMMPIMNVFNEWHAANTSKKIRAALLSGMRSGRYTCWSYPYGYETGSDGLRTAVVDETAAATVGRIFDMRLMGFSARAIARALTNDGVPSPAAYYASRKGGSGKRCAPYWSPKTVRDILSNPVYTGRTVQHKTTRVSYKNHAVTVVPESERVVRENAHPPIVSRDVWERVQASFRGPRGRSDKRGKVDALSGLLVCADCGKKLKYRSDCGAYVCRTYADLGASFCPSHRVSAKTLERAIVNDIRGLTGAIAVDEKGEREKFAREFAARAASDGRRIKEVGARLSELDRLMRAAFERSVSGDLPESVCAELVKDYRAEKERLTALAAELVKKGDGEDARAEKYVGLVEAYVSVETLTRELALRLIDKIVVGRGEIHIVYKCKAPSLKAP